MRRAAGLFLTLSCILLLTYPADARRIRLLRIPSFKTESIEPVYDLPNKEPFLKEGQYLDLGYLNSPRGNSYVLYAGERFIRLDDAGLSALKLVLGFDPTATHRQQRAAENATEIAAAARERAHKNERIAAGTLLEPYPGETREAFAARRQAFVDRHRASSQSSAVADTAEAGHKPRTGGRFLDFGTILILLLMFGVLGRKFFGRKASRAATSARGEVPDLPGSFQSFDRRVALRLAELQSPVPLSANLERGSGLPVEAGPPMSATVKSAGFGRKRA